MSWQAFRHGYIKPLCLSNTLSTVSARSAIIKSTLNNVSHIVINNAGNDRIPQVAGTHRGTECSGRNIDSHRGTNTRRI